MGFECLQEWRPHTLRGQPAPELGHPQDSKRGDGQSSHPRHPAKVKDIEQYQRHLQLFPFCPVNSLCGRQKKACPYWTVHIRIPSREDTCLALSAGVQRCVRYRVSLSSLHCRAGKVCLCQTHRINPRFGKRQTVVRVRSREVDPGLG